MAKELTSAHYDNVLGVILRKQRDIYDAYPKLEEIYLNKCDYKQGEVLFIEQLELANAMLSLMKGGDWCCRRNRR